jgi:hypothetical protein
MRFCAPAEPPTGHLQPPRAAALREPIIPYYPEVPTTNKYQRAKIKEQPGYRREWKGAIAQRGGLGLSEWSKNGRIGAQSGPTAPQATTYQLC